MVENRSSNSLHLLSRLYRKFEPTRTQQLHQYRPDNSIREDDWFLRKTSPLSLVLVSLSFQFTTDKSSINTACRPLIDERRISVPGHCIIEITHTCRMLSDLPLAPKTSDFQTTMYCTAVQTAAMVLFILYYMVWCVVKYVKVLVRDERLHNTCTAQCKNNLYITSWQGGARLVYREIFCGQNLLTVEGYPGTWGT